MKKIEKWLIKNSKINAIQSQSTVSRYYNIGHLNIRISDHLKPSITSDSDLQIIYPTSSNCDYYTVIYNNSNRLMILNAKQLIELIPTLVKLKELTIVEKPLSNLQDKTIKQTRDKITLVYPPSLITCPNLGKKYYQIIYKRKSTWNPNEINLLTGMLNNKYTSCSGFNGVFREFLQSYPCTCKEALTLYWVICVKAQLTPTDDLLLEAMSYIEKNYNDK